MGAIQEPAITDFVNYGVSVKEVLDFINAGPVIAGANRILIKPNLVTDKPFPVTTAPECCEAVIDYVRSYSVAPIVIAEGTGDPHNTTADVFHSLGYTTLASKKQVKLADLNNEPVIRLENPECRRFPEFFMPKIAMDHFIISVPVLKAHLLSDFTGSLKNMMGFAPPAHYSGAGGIWNKSEFHIDIHQAIADMNRYRQADLTVLDASVGMKNSHLGGPFCDPPVKKLIAGFDPVAVDRQAAKLLSMDWKEIGHLANGTW